MVGEKARRQSKPGKFPAPRNVTKVGAYHRQEFVAGYALAPPEVTVDEATMQQYNKEMEDAANHPLPDEDDPDL